MGRFFDMDSGLMRFLNRVADLLILNIVFLICCIPVITIGASCTALYYVAMKLAANEDSYIVRGFFKSFRQNFRQSTIIWIIVLLFAAIFSIDTAILRESTGSLVNVFKIVILAAGVFFLFVVTYVFPTLAKFDNTIKKTFYNAFVFSIISFPRTLAMIAIPILFVFVLFVNNMTFSYGLLFLLMFGFSCYALINSYLIKPVFARFIPAEEEEENTSSIFSDHYVPADTRFTRSDAQEPEKITEDSKNAPQ